MCSLISRALLCTWSSLASTQGPSASSCGQGRLWSETARIRRMTQVLPGCTCHCVGFTVLSVLHLIIRQMSHCMPKPQNDLCALWRLRSAWASPQSDLSLCCPHEETLGPWLSLEHTAKDWSDWVDAGCTCHFIGYVMHRLKWWQILFSENPSKKE